MSEIINEQTKTSLLSRAVKIGQIIFNSSRTVSSEDEFIYGKAFIDPKDDAEGIGVTAEREIAEPGKTPSNINHQKN